MELIDDIETMDFEIEIYYENSPINKYIYDK